MNRNITTTIAANKHQGGTEVGQNHERSRCESKISNEAICDKRSKAKSSDVQRFEVHPASVKMEPPTESDSTEAQVK